jgi:ribosomal protein S18 acetylase RimI-like enzyme
LDPAYRSCAAIGSRTKEELSGTYQLRSIVGSSLARFETPGDRGMIVVRAARDEDHLAIVQLWHQGWHDAHAELVPGEILAFRTPMHFKLWLEEADDQFYVATDQGLLGFISVKGAEIVKLYVGRNARGTGVARSLLSFGEQLLFKKGFKEAELFCTAGNTRAQKFYEREGWSLSLSFEDALWLPKNIAGRFSVETHRYRKTLKPSV